MSDGETYSARYRRGGFGYDKDIAVWRPWVERHYVNEFNIKPGTRLLDVGCGDGFWAQLFDELDIEVTGVDASKGGIDVAKTRTVDHAKFLVCDISKPLPFEDGYFDVAFMRGLSLFHSADPLAEAHVLRNVAPKVRVGGMLLMSINTLMTGTIPEGASAYHHRPSTLWAVMETVSRPTKMTSEGNYFQFAARV